MPLSKLNTLVFPRILNALNDNLFKTTLLTLIAVRITQQTADPSNIVAGLLILPFFCFPPAPDSWPENITAQN